MIWRGWLDKTMRKIITETAEEHGLTFDHVFEVVNVFFACIVYCISDVRMPKITVRDAFGTFYPDKTKILRKLRYSEKHDKELYLKEDIEKTLERIVQEKERRTIKHKGVHESWLKHYRAGTLETDNNEQK